jgi:hypothetical protein
MTQQDSTVTVLRRLLLGLLLFGLAGTATELLLISHDEDIWQTIPIVAIALAILVSLGLAVTSRAAPPAALLRLFQGMMVVLILTGGTGMVLHYRANMEFKLEMDPTLEGFALFWSVVRAKTPPALAPATLALLGLLGLTHTFRRRDDPPSATR